MPQFITASKGSAHITPAQDSMTHRGLAGASDYVLSEGDSFSPDIVSNQEIKINSGIGAIQGRYFCIEPYDSDSVTIENGTQGYKRIDAICAHVTCDSATGTQALDWVVITGAPSAGTPTPPTIPESDLDAGDQEAWMDLIHVELNGVNVTSAKVVAPILHGLEMIREDLSAFLQVGSHTSGSISCEGGGTVSGSFNISKAGYIPVAICGYSFAGTNYSTIDLYRIILSASGSGTGTVAYSIRSVGASNITATMTVNVLWRKAV